MYRLVERWKIYFAGCFDCDGGGSCSQINGTTPRIRLYIANNEESFLNLYRSNYGGRISRSGQTCKSWEIDARSEQLKFLTDIRPYVFIKVPVVELAWEFLHLDVGKGGKTSIATEKARTRRKEIAIELTNFNHRFEIARGDFSPVTLKDYL